MEEKKNDSLQFFCFHSLSLPQLLFSRTSCSISLSQYFCSDLEIKRRFYSEKNECCMLFIECIMRSLTYFLFQFFFSCGFSSVITRKQPIGSCGHDDVFFFLGIRHAYDQNTISFANNLFIFFYLQPKCQCLFVFFCFLFSCAILVLHSDSIFSYFWLNN